MKPVAKCTRCDSVLEEDDCCDISIDETVSLYILGYCPKCGLSHQWIEVYEKTRISECKATEEF